MRALTNDGCGIHLMVAVAKVPEACMAEKPGAHCCANKIFHVNPYQHNVSTLSKVLLDDELLDKASQ